MKRPWIANWKEISNNIIQISEHNFMLNVDPCKITLIHHILSEFINVKLLMMNQVSNSKNPINENLKIRLFVDVTGPHAVRDR